MLDTFIANSIHTGQILALTLTCPADIYHSLFARSILINSLWFFKTHDDLPYHSVLIWCCNTVFNGACLSLGSRDCLRQGHWDLWILRITAVIKTGKLQESLMEMENMTCGRDHLSLWLFPTVYQAITPLQTATKTGCAAEGTVAQGQSSGGWRSAQEGGMGSTHVWAALQGWGSAGSQGWAIRAVTCECWALKHQHLNCFYFFPRFFFSIQLVVVITKCHLYLHAKSVASSDV